MQGGSLKKVVKSGQDYSSELKNVAGAGEDQNQKG